MIKKSFLTAVLSLTIAGGAYAAVPAMAQNDEPKSEVTVNAQWEELSLIPI